MRSTIGGDRSRQQLGAHAEGEAVTNCHLRADQDVERATVDRATALQVAQPALLASQPSPQNSPQRQLHHATDGTPPGAPADFTVRSDFAQRRLRTWSLESVSPASSWEGPEP